jgi:DHA1 family bicyclomycin/chloramphenicol resistance-like MFS transporter
MARAHDARHPSECNPAMSAPATTANPIRRTIGGSLLFLLVGLAALGSLATNIILPAFTQIGAALHTSERELALTLSSFFFVFAFGQLFIGPLSDRFGRKSLVLFGLGTFVAGSVVCTSAGTLEFMIAGRVLQALGACATSVLSRAVARDLFDGEALGKTLALIMMAMAAAPGFSPLVGTGLVTWLGWRFIFVFVGVFAIVLAVHYWRSVEETHPADRRTSLTSRGVASIYRDLVADRRFILPALSVSLVLGGLYTFFATAPSIFAHELGLTGFQLAVFFAATVVVPFAAGYLAPLLAHRWGQPAIAMAGLVSTVVGSLSMLAIAGAPELATITISLALFLFGMGLVNPLGTAISLHPFGEQAGSASALLGFLQMGCAAVGSALGSILPFPPTVALAIILTSGSMLALIAFVPVFASEVRTKVLVP